MFGGTYFCKLCRRMSLVCQYLTVYLPLTVSMVISIGNTMTSGKTLPPIFWNSSNPIYKADNNDHIIDAYQEDEIEFICPYYKGLNYPKSKFEYYVIYAVSQSEYESCVLYDTTDAFLIVNCSEPLKPIEPERGTFWIYEFQPAPGRPDFHPNNRYYFITTSQGSLSGINNQVEGACLYKNMRLILNVHGYRPTAAPDTTPKGHTDRPFTTRRPTHRPNPTTMPTTTTSTTRRTTSRTTVVKLTTKRPEDPNGNYIDKNPSKNTIIDATGPQDTGEINGGHSVHNTVTLIHTLTAIVTLWYLFRR